MGSVCQHTDRTRSDPITITAIMILLSLLLGLHFSSDLSLARSTYLTSEVITGRGVAEPPRLNIRTFQRNDEEYYRHTHNPAYSQRQYQPSRPRDIYTTLRDKLHSNEQIQKYIVSLKKQLQQRDQSRVKQPLEVRDYNRATSVDLYDGVPRGSPGLNLVESFQTDTSGSVLSTDKWLEYRDQVAPDTTTFPVRWPAVSQTRGRPSDDIITVDNIYKFVEPPRGPDTFTVNVESALNFSG